MPTFYSLIISVLNWLIMFIDIKSVTCAVHNVHSCHGEAFISGNQQNMLRNPRMTSILLFFGDFLPFCIYQVYH